MHFALVVTAFWVFLFAAQRHFPWRWAVQTGWGCVGAITVLIPCSLALLLFGYFAPDLGAGTAAAATHAPSIGLVAGMVIATGAGCGVLLAQLLLARCLPESSHTTLVPPHA